MIKFWWILLLPLLISPFFQNESEKKVPLTFKEALQQRVIIDEDGLRIYDYEDHLRVRWLFEEFKDTTMEFWIEEDNPYVIANLKYWAYDPDAGNLYVFEYQIRVRIFVKPQVALIGDMGRGISLYPILFEI